MDADLQNLGRRLVGRWSTEATHPYLPGAEIRGSSEIDWLDGEQFLVYRSSYDHPDIPDALAVIGDTDGLRMHYFDSRGVYRIYDVVVTPNGWVTAMGRGAPPGSFASPNDTFSQRMTYTFEDEDRVISGKGRLSHDDVKWEDDLQITYRRA